MPKPELRDELANVGADQLKAREAINKDANSADFLNQYKTRFPDIEGEIGIEELYESDVAIAIAKVVMENLRQSTAGNIQSPAQPQKADPKVTELFLHGVV